MAGIIPFAGADDDVHVVVFPRVGRVRQIIVRTVEVDVVVVIAVEEIADIESAAQANEMADHVGMTKGDVGGVICAQTRAANADAMRGTFASRQIEDVVDDHALKRDMSNDAIGRMDRFVVKTRGIDRIRTINRDSAAIDERRTSIGELEILVLIKAAEGSGKKDQRKPAAITENQHLEIAA